MSGYDYVPKVNPKAFRDLRPGDIVRVAKWADGRFSLTAVVKSEFSVESRNWEVTLDSGEVWSHDVSRSFHQMYRVYKRIKKK